MLVKLGIVFGIAGVVGAGVRYAFIIIRSIILAFSDLHKVVHNHIPHIYSQLQGINEKLYYLKGSQDHEIREDPPSISGRDRFNIFGVELE